MIIHEDAMLPLPRSRIITSLNFETMIVIFSFGEKTARQALFDRRESDFHGGNWLEPEGGFEQMKRAVETYRAKVVPRFAHAHLNQENVSALIEFVEIGLDDCIQRLAGTDLLELPFTRKNVEVVIQDCEDAIDDLQNAYQVTDTEPLEAVRDKLRAWLDDLNRQWKPRPSFPEGPPV